MIRCRRCGGPMFDMPRDVEVGVAWQCCLHCGEVAYGEAPAAPDVEVARQQPTRPGRRYLLRPEVVAAIQQQLAAGASEARLAREHGCAVSTIHKVRQGQYGPTATERVG